MADRAKVVMYGTRSCSYCMAARMLFKKKGVDFEEVSVSDDSKMRRRMELMSGRRTVPQIFIDEQPIGGFDDLYTLEQNGTLERLLERTATAPPTDTQT